MNRRVYPISDPGEIRELINLIDYYGLVPICVGRGAEWPNIESFKLAHKMSTYPRLSTYMVIEAKESNLEITTRYWTKYFPYGTQCTYIFNLNGEEKSVREGLRCYNEFCKAHHITKANTYEIEALDKYYNPETNKYVCSAAQILGFNPKYNLTELHNCYEYDLNSAFSTQILKQIPDISKPKYSKDMIKVKKNEIGFLIDDKLTMIEPGNYADIVFPLIDTPTKLKDFITRWYTRKKTATTTVEKDSAKAMLNLPIGYLQRTQPFLRAYVVNSCNKYIKSIMDENTVLWNTDAIFSLVERPDLEIGNEIGQFKRVDIDRLIYNGNTYQIDDEFPKYRGIAKGWFITFEKLNGRKFDLLQDYNTKLPRINKYYFDWNTMKLEETDFEEINTNPKE